MEWWQEIAHTHTLVIGRNSYLRRFRLTIKLHQIILLNALKEQGIQNILGDCVHKDGILGGIRHTTAYYSTMMGAGL